MVAPYFQGSPNVVIVQLYVIFQTNGRRFENVGIDPSFYANRRMGFDEILPWAHIDSGVTQKFLLSEAKKALGEETTPDCLTKCSGCGAAKFGSDLCAKRCIKSVKEEA